MHAAGTDREDAPAHYENPGEGEIAGSLDSVCPGWWSISSDDLRGYHISGQPPLDLTAEKLAEYTAESKQIAEQARNDPQIQAMIALLPSQLLSQFNCNKMHPVTKPESIVCLWLKDKMRLLCVRKELADKTLFII